ncbi:MAG: protein phosphatase CheZ [Pseudomonadota bacterium]
MMELASPPEIVPAANSLAFVRIGNIVRTLHDALQDIGANDALAQAANEFPSARERLMHIAQLTEKAANCVLNKVEEASPVQDRLARKAALLGQQWQNAQVPEGMGALAGETAQFVAETEATCRSTQAALSDIMMAQDFQDLTGQLIKKVVALIEQTEHDLLGLLIDAAPPGAISHVKKEEMMAGPGAVGGVALDQANVDDLLADLGF